MIKKLIISKKNNESMWKKYLYKIFYAYTVSLLYIDKIFI